MCITFFTGPRTGHSCKWLSALLAACLLYLWLPAQTTGAIAVGGNKGKPVAFNSLTQAAKSNPADTLQRNNIHKAIDLLQQDIVKAVNIKSKAATQLLVSFGTTVDAAQLSIEKNEQLNNAEKFTHLKGWQTLLNESLIGLNAGDIAAQKIPLLLHGYESAINLAVAGSSILQVITQNDLSVGLIILRSMPTETIGFKEAENYIVLKTFEQQPAIFFRVLYEFADVPCADSLLPIAARRLPEDLYTYSQASRSVLGKRIFNSSDSLVKLISTISAWPEGRLYFPFLDDLYHKRQSFADIKKTFGPDKRIRYYKLLVKAMMGYVERMNQGDTAIAIQSAAAKLAYNALHDFVYVINELHEYPDKTRLKVLETLTAPELYYLCITGVNDLYTSSYLKIYDRMFSRGFTKESYGLLKTVHFDHFKRFIKMASTFNTLDDFLIRMTKLEADSLLRAFVNGLDAAGSVEDAVDVADSYASIRNENLRRFILLEIENKISSNQDSTASTAHVYKLLRTIFRSLDTAAHIDLSVTLGISPVYQVENSFLKDSLGRINVQQFFYGDKDGRYAYNIFLRSFRNANWKIINSRYWVEFVSTRGIPVHIYSNKPLDDDTNEAEKAQAALSKYLYENNRAPSFLIHRGHSYYLNNTLQYLSAANKLIFLGSCGGYKNLEKVFKSSPLAHIITTKQEGTGIINQPMIDYFCEELRTGKNLDWPTTWKVLKLRFKGDPRFDDYVPPHQNLGAILIVALNKIDRDEAEKR